MSIQEKNSGSTPVEAKNREYFTTITYGCQMNESDSEHIAGQLQSMGYQFTADIHVADIIIINTCCVRESAEKKIYGKIGELKKLKTAKPDLVIAISGCMAQKDKEALFKKAPHVDLVIGTHNIYQFVENIKQIKASKKKVLAVGEEGERPSPAVPAVRKGQVSAWVPIMHGCNNFCTYCIVPYVRGRERSRPLEDIVTEVTELGKAGFKEITLLGQNVNSYGKDTPTNADFADLLQAIDQIDSIERIRFMTSHPRDMNEKVIEVIKNGAKICEHVHLPVQSGSDTILARMNRGYTADHYRRLVEQIREKIPDVSITTDIIVGFPGETEQLFEETLAFLKMIRFDAAYTFLYSPRSGTPAAEMTEQVPPEIKKRRLQQLMQVQNEISLTINKQLEGRRMEVLVEGTSKNDVHKMTGRTRTNKIVIWDKTQEKIGQLVEVMVTGAQTWVLKGQIAN
ncbi:radical sam [Lucifera butyrica]|uniref:tRNA-2-methylthio-N(6)-dimethylallyladenosine synthase n=1 Tax=Lucifera butyrica TaxID=1351585 RepID=A0A498RA23_9FIRM|nr:tRNA (N6-isopentenyl adenosine(37)-C2)-methylthiotransferase MiaB [Lucifera butyrica]VBB05998.1 radical sam [Lucifera butyrica]